MVVVEMFLKVLRLIVKVVLFIVGLLLSFLGQGLLLLTTVLAFISYFFTGFFFLLAILATFIFTDPGFTLIEKIAVWTVAIISGVISYNFANIPEYLVITGARLMNF